MTMTGDDRKTKCGKCGHMVDVTVGLSAPGAGPTKKLCLACFDKQCKAVGRMVRQVRSKLR